MKKKLLTILTICCMLFFVIGVTGCVDISRDNGKPTHTHVYENGICSCGDIRGSSDLEYELINNGTEYEVSDIGLCDDTNIVIPVMYCGKPVTSIGYEAFSNCSKLTSIEIPDSITSIGNGAFWGCDSLTSIVIPDSVTSINSFAFYNCSSLTSIEIPDSITHIGMSTFKGCSLLFEIKDSIKYVKANNNPYFMAYEVTNKNLASYTIQNGTKYLGYELFADCNKLTKITIPDSVTSINSFAFSSCDLLESIVIPESVTAISANAFFYSKKLTSVTFKDCSNWYRINHDEDNAHENWINKTGGIQVDVTNPEISAYYLEEESDYYWYKL